MIEIFVDETKAIGWEGERLASLQEFELADRSVGSLFETLAPKEGIILQQGIFVLNSDIDPVPLQEFADEIYASLAPEPFFQDLIKQLEAINPGFAQAVQEEGLGTSLTASEYNGVLFDFESGTLFENLPAEWQDWIASDAFGRDEAYAICADWAMRFASVVFSQIG